MNILLMSALFHDPVDVNWLIFAKYMLKLESDVINWRHDVRISRNSQEIFLLTFAKYCASFKSFGPGFVILWQLVWFGLNCRKSLIFANGWWQKCRNFFSTHDFDLKFSGKMQNWIWLKVRKIRAFGPCQFFTRFEKPEGGGTMCPPFRFFKPCEKLTRAKGPYFSNF